MGRRSRFALVLTGVLPATVLAQQPADTSQPVVIFSAAMMPRSPMFVILSGGTAYRFELVPFDSIEVRHVNPSARRPRRYLSMENPSRVRRGDALVVVPEESGEYRIEIVRFGSGEPIQVRIVRDPRETQILAGTRQPPDRRSFSIGVRGNALITDFEAVRSDASGTRESGSAIGPELCLGIVPGRIEAFQRLGGCAFTVSLYTQGGDARIMMFGVAPSVLLSRGDLIEVALAATFGFGKASLPYRRDVQYTLLGAGLSFTWVVGSRLRLEAQPGVGLMRTGAYQLQPTVVDPTPGKAPASTAVIPRVVVGFHVPL